MLKRSEGYFKGYQDLRLYYQKWEPQNIKGLLLITHGHGEHSDCYHRVVEALENQGWLIIAWDWRGHGRSDGQRGYAQDFDEYVHDFECFTKMIFDGFPQAVPKVLLAHSMGGLIQLKAVLSGQQDRFRAQVLSSPMLGLSVQVPTHKEIAAQVLHHVLPQVTLSNQIRSEDVTRDPLIIRELERDVLRHDRISSGVYLGSLRAIDFVSKRATKLKLPSLFQISDIDEVVSSEAINNFFNQLKGDHLLKIYPQRKHEIYNDLGREEVLTDLREYLKKLV
jgi:alpha-beta hydrolase superfamily lysophospholipase